ncbi:unnamed protein product, partial [Mesorhabditis spiculigera]
MEPINSRNSYFSPSPNQCTCLGEPIKYLRLVDTTAPCLDTTCGTFIEWQQKADAADREQYVEYMCGDGRGVCEGWEEHVSKKVPAQKINKCPALGGPCYLHMKNLAEWVYAPPDENSNWIVV